DRISELPDEIIHRILGGLDTHESAARTCILSSRWLHLWNSYPVSG
ncbi:F-box/FBD/LRR-repeat protein At5g22660, partial [Linum grandiflorum]